MERGASKIIGDILAASGRAEALYIMPVRFACIVSNTANGTSLATGIGRTDMKFKFYKVDAYNDYTYILYPNNKRKKTLRPQDFAIN